MKFRHPITNEYIKITADEDEEIRLIQVTKGIIGYHKAWELHNKNKLLNYV